MKRKIAILLPYKERYTVNEAAAASIWVKDYLKNSKLANQTLVFGNIEKSDVPITNNFVNLNNDTLYSLLDAIQGSGDRSIYALSPLTGATTLSFLSTGNYYASVDITNDNRIFAIAGNNASAAERASGVRDPPESILPISSTRSIGFNCALGATELRPWLTELSNVADIPISCHPNAGLPNEFGGYDETPKWMAGIIEEFANSGLVNISLSGRVVGHLMTQISCDRCQIRAFQDQMFHL